MEGLVKNLAN